MKQLGDYLQYLRAEDVLEATEKAKIQARTLLEDQGIAMLGLMLAEILADVIRQGAPEMTDPVPAKPPVLS